jgi:hypothetical protein
MGVGGAHKGDFVGWGRAGGSGHVVNLHEGDAGGVFEAGELERVGAGVERDEEGGVGGAG